MENVTFTTTEYTPGRLDLPVGLTTISKGESVGGSYFMDSGHFQDMMDHIDEKVNLGAFPVAGGDYDDYSSAYGNRFMLSTDKYGNDTSGIKPHKGIDIRANEGTDLFAMYGGKVIEIRDNTDKGDGHGFYIVIEAEVDGKKSRIHIRI